MGKGREVKMWADDTNQGQIFHYLFRQPPEICQTYIKPIAHSGARAILGTITPELTKDILVCPPNSLLDD